MTMVSTGPISLGGNATTGGLNQSVNIELGRAATATINMNESAVRTLAGVPSGAISMSNFYGKANEFSFTISSNQTDANLRTLAVNAGWNQSSALVATIASGVYLSSSNTGTPALTVNGSFPGGVRLVNNGFIIGRGGNGGNGGTSNPFPSGPSFRAGSNGAAGGLALSVAVAVQINNAGTIAGGGGGGGGGGSFSGSDGESVGVAAGGPGGGGIGISVGGTTPSTSGWGGQSGTGQSGTLTAAGGATDFTGGIGGAGGGYGASGANGTKRNYGDPIVYFNAPAYAGGSGGGAVSGNSNITWLATGTRIGTIA